jgi:hypothetical protein
MEGLFFLVWFGFIVAIIGYNLAPSILSKNSALSTNAHPHREVSRLWLPSLCYEKRLSNPCWQALVNPH